MKILQGRKIYSVSEVNYFAREILEQMQFWVEGEISSIRKNPNWNFYYLDIKDEKAVLSCIADGLIFNNSEQDLVGQSVLIHGNLTLYEPLGKFQLRIYSLEIIGEGYLQKKLEDGLQADVTSFGLPGQDLVPLARDISFPVASDIEPIDKMKLKFGARKNGS